VVLHARFRSCRQLNRFSFCDGSDCTRACISALAMGWSACCKYRLELWKSQGRVDRYVDSLGLSDWDD
jgi:hypothetical protein